MPDESLLESANDNMDKNRLGAGLPCKWTHVLLKTAFLSGLVIIVEKWFPLCIVLNLPLIVAVNMCYYSSSRYVLLQ